LIVLEERMQEPAGPDRHSWTPIGDYAEGLVRGFVEHRERIDGLLAEHSRGWTVERMPAVDRAILRIAVYELLYSTEVPPAVVVNEAVDSAKVLSTDDSPRFVNGILGQLAVITPQLRGA
jgi:N utilization substance protein B